jgi:hypothetical protein
MPSSSSALISSRTSASPPITAQPAPSPAQPTSEQQGGILAVEAYHAGLVRTTINALDAGSGTLTGITQKISAFRSMLANPTLPSPPPMTNGGLKQDDQGIDNSQMVALNGTTATYASTTILDADNNSITFSRTPQQILAIVTGTAPSATTHQGVFFPSGLNGTIK